MNSGLVLVALLCIVSVHATLTSSTFQVRRNVKDYGAVGDGVTDDTKAFIAALTEGKATVSNPGPWYNSQYGSQTTKPTIVFVPNGTYVLSATIPVVYYTQLVGDFNNRPTLLFVNADCSASGPGACVDAGQDQQGHGWYPDQNQNNFYRMIRNIIIDARQSPNCKYNIHWQVGQATNLEYLDLYVASGATGIYGESGSGGYANSIRIFGNNIGTGITMGNQQFTLRNITIDATGNINDGIYILWGWSWSLININIKVDNGGGIRLGNPVAACSIIDAYIGGGPYVGISLGSATELEVDNVAVSNVIQPLNIYSASGVTTYSPFPGSFVHLKPAGGAATYTGKWIAPVPRSYLLSRQMSTAESPIQTSLPLPMYQGWMRPHYAAEDMLDASGILKSGTDVTDVLQQLINNATKLGKMLFLPYGNYLITDTINIPAGAKIEGEVWTKLSATGAKFSDPSNPRVVLRVGSGAHHEAPVHLMDLLFTNEGPIPGAIFVEWNVKAPIPSPTNLSKVVDVAQVSGIWDCHFRIGGAVGTNQSQVNCPKTATDEENPECRGAHTLLQFTKNATTTFVSSLWAWVADHNLDDKAESGNNIFNARGVTSASAGPLWLYGTAAEHSMLYQLNLEKEAMHTLITIFQSETPYFQPQTPVAKAVSPLVPSDPPVRNTTMHAYAVAINIPQSDVTPRHLQWHGAGMYSFFDQWKTSCKQCQEELVLVYDGDDKAQLSGPPPTPDASVNFILINTHGASTVANLWGTNITAAANPNGFCETTSYFGYSL